MITQPAYIRQELRELFSNPELHINFPEEISIRDNSGKVEVTYRQPPLQPGSTNTEIQLDLHPRENTAHLRYLQRDDSIQGQGLGKKIYKAIERFLLDEGCAGITLSSAQTKHDSFWESLGFTDKGDHLEKPLL